MQEEYVYVKRDPTNVAWEDTNLSTVVDAFVDYGWEILPGPPWGGEPQWVYENGWNDCDEQLDDGSPTGTRHHCRLFELSNGDIVGNTHYEYWDWSKLDHVITSYEHSENHVADEFDNPDWDVYEDSVWMANNKSPPKYNNGRLTRFYP